VRTELQDWVCFICFSSFFIVIVRFPFVCVYYVYENVILFCTLQNFCLVCFTALQHASIRWTSDVFDETRWRMWQWWCVQSKIMYIIHLCNNVENRLASLHLEYSFNCRLFVGCIQWKHDHNLHDFQSGDTPLMRACFLGRVDAVKFFLESTTYRLYNQTSMFIEWVPFSL